MSHNYGSTFGYGIKLGKFDEQKMIKFLLSSQYIKDWLEESDIDFDNECIDNTFLDVFEDYESDYGEIGLFPAFYDALFDLEIFEEDLADWIKDYSLQRDYEDGCFYLLYIPETFPTKIVRRQDVDAVFLKIMDTVGMDEKIDYQNVHWFG